jgi:hypothetical protein
VEREEGGAETVLVAGRFRVILVLRGRRREGGRGGPTGRRAQGGRKSVLGMEGGREGGREGRRFE